MLLIDEVRIPACSDIELRDRIPSIIGVSPDELKEIVVLRRSLDARKRRGVEHVFRVAVALRDGGRERLCVKKGVRMIEALPPAWCVPPVKVRRPDRPVVIVGSGPAGLFAAWTLLSRGVPVVILEMGKRVEERVRDLALFWRKGSLDRESNVQFGEGGAGCFSDGKLTTRVKAPELGFVIRLFSEFTGLEELPVLGKPHVGTNHLRRFVTRMRREIERMGGEIRYASKVVDIERKGNLVRGVRVRGEGVVEGSHFVLAPGHSSRDTYSMLAERGVALEAKPFAVGVRVEHPQEVVDEIQYGQYAHCGCLPPADYRVSIATGRGKDLYSFCMCPGGIVILCSSDGEDVVVNGMSPSGRRTGFANSGFVVQISGGEAGSSWKGGIEFQRAIEREAFERAGKAHVLPAMRLSDFLRGKKGSGDLPPGRWGAVDRVHADLRGIFPLPIEEAIIEGLWKVGRVMRGFITGSATVYAVESRTSSPVKIVRRKDFRSPTFENLFPCGEGAGYAGGISSSAVDGVKVGVAILTRLAEE